MFVYSLQYYIGHNSILLNTTKKTNMAVIFSSTRQNLDDIEEFVGGSSKDWGNM